MSVILSFVLNIIIIVLLGATIYYAIKLSRSLNDFRTYREDFEKAGMMITGVNPNTNLVEIVELKDHPWFIGVQFHPELKSTVERPHPLFVNFVRAACKL